MKTVIIAGGSISGLTAAQMLSKHDDIEHVIIVERDTYPEGIAGRKGAPNNDHTHNLSAGGTIILGDVFPNLFNTIRTAGGRLLRWGDPNVRVSFKTGYLTQTEYIGVSTWSMSRNLLESAMRQEVQQNKKVFFLNKVDVVGLVRNGIPSTNQIVGLFIKPRQGAELPQWAKFVSDGKYRIIADEVVLATGSGHQWQDWFEAADISVPPMREVDGKLLYVSADYKNVVMPVTMFATGDKDDRAMIISEIEGETFRVTIQVHGYQGDWPVAHDDFVRLAATCSEEAAGYLMNAELVNGKIHIFPDCANRLFELWKVADWPANLYFLGDIFARFSPQYGQGMTMGVKQAQLLTQIITSGQTSRDYNAQLEKLAEFSWQLATGADQTYLRWANDPSVPPLNMVGRLGAAYFAILLDLAGSNVDVARAFFQVSNYVAEPSALTQWVIVRAALSEAGKRAVRKVLPFMFKAKAA